MIKDFDLKVEYLIEKLTDLFYRRSYAKGGPMLHTIQREGQR